MTLAAWWITDHLPNLNPIDGLSVTQSHDDHELAIVNGLTVSAVRQRRNEGHIPYVARLNGQVVAYGWAATKRAEIGELSLQFSIPTHSRYLWDFATLPDFQGRGVYPHLLQAILQHESADVFFILVAPENLPSEEGVRRAGFSPIGQLSYRAYGGVGLLPYAPIERARAGAALLGVPVIDEALLPCWRCGSAAVCDCCTDLDTCSCAIPLRHVTHARLMNPLLRR